MAFVIDLLLGMLLDGAIFAALDFDYYRVQHRKPRLNAIAIAALAGVLVAIVALVAITSFFVLILVSAFALPVGVLIVEAWSKWRSRTHEPAA